MFKFLRDKLTYVALQNYAFMYGIYAFRNENKFPFMLPTKFSVDASHNATSVHSVTLMKRGVLPAAVSPPALSSRLFSR